VIAVRRVLLLTIALAAALAPGCGYETIDDATCPPGGTALRYTTFAAPFFASNCNTCHSAPLGSRQGAPENYVFETRDEIVEHKDRIFVRAAGTNDSMPPGPDDPPATTRQKLAEWLVCGAP
jgi:uncharacterized membrane protein